VLGILAVFGLGGSILAVTVLRRLLRGIRQIRDAMREIANGLSEAVGRFKV
jgi:hypothetical protein